MKKYLVCIDHQRGARVSIGFYTDTPTKNYRVYYCGSDTGARFAYIGNAARYLEKMREIWTRDGAPPVLQIYSTKNEIPRRGSNA